MIIKMRFSAKKYEQLEGNTPNWVRKFDGCIFTFDTTTSMHPWHLGATHLGYMAINSFYSISSVHCIPLILKQRYVRKLKKENRL